MTIAFLRMADRDLPSATRRRPSRAQPLDHCDSCPVRALSICSALEGEGFETLRLAGLETTFGSRAALFMEGESADAVFNVTEGLVRLFRLFPDGRRQVVGFALPGDFLGLPPEDVHMFSADAAVPTITCRFARRAFAELLDTHPGLLRRVHDSAVRTLDLAHDQMMLLGHPRAEGKIAAFLVGLRKRWMRVRGASMLVPLPMGRQDIGDFLGMSISTVSRTINRLARAGLIAIVPSGIHVLDLPGLQAVAEG